MPTAIRPYKPPAHVLTHHLAAIPLAQLSTAELRLLVRSLGAQANHWQAEATRMNGLLRAALRSPQIPLPNP